MHTDGSAADDPLLLAFKTMSSHLTPKSIRRSISKFRDYSGDIASADYNTFDDRLNRFFAFCESDPTFSKVHDQLTQMPSANLETWLAERQSGSSNRAKLEFPTDEEQRLALQYQILVAFREKKLSWTSFALQFFALRHATGSDYIYAINDAITEPLMRDLEYRLEDLDDELPADERADVPSSFIQIIHNATNVINQSATGSNIEQHAAIHHSEELSTKFQELRQLVEHESTNKDQDLELIEAAEREAATPDPKSSVVGALLKGLSITGSSASIISGIVALIG